MSFTEYQSTAKDIKVLHSILGLRCTSKDLTEYQCPFPEHQWYIIEHQMSSKCSSVLYQTSVSFTGHQCSSNYVSFLHHLHHHYSAENKRALQASNLDHSVLSAAIFLNLSIVG